MMASSQPSPSPQPRRTLAPAGAGSRGEGAKPFSIPVRIYYEDTDVGGVVYYANYLRFIERARTEWLRAAGFELDVIQREMKAVFVVRRVEADYHAPALLGNLITVTAEPTDVGASRLIIRQRITRRNDSVDELLFSAIVTLAFIASDLSGPIRMPAAMRAAMKSTITQALA
jgi:acyl-CoA thioester hydrolase